MEPGFFTTTLVQPLYNGLIFLMGFLPGVNAGVAIVVFTIIIKLILYPFSKKSIQAQAKMKLCEPELEIIKSKYKDNKQAQAEKIMAFYKEKGLNPFSGFLLILVQIPIIFALYYVFLKSGLPDINTEMLYSFINSPTSVSMSFLGISDIATKSYILAFLCSVSQYFQINLSMPAPKPKGQGPANFKDDLARSMSLQMRYFFPIVVFFISYNLSGTIALYWLTSNLFAIGQEVYIRKRLNLPSKK